MSPKYYFVAGDYYATGEGRTVALLITRAYGNTELSGNDRALTEFSNRAGALISLEAQALTREQFFTRFGHFLPNLVSKALDSADAPGNFNFYVEYHVNFS